MSEAVICVIHGACTKIEEETTGWVTFHVNVGREYPVKLKTKKAEIITAARAVGGNVASWKYQFSLGNENPHQPGTRYKNRYLEAVKEGQHGEVTQEPDLEAGASQSQPAGDPFAPEPTAAPQSTTAPVTTVIGNAGKSEEMTKEDWDAKERRDFRSRAWAHTISAFQHTIKVDEDPEEVFARLQPFHRKVYGDICQSFSYPGDESDIPF